MGHIPFANAIPNHLENVGIRRQGKNNHHHAFDAGCALKQIGGMLQMMQKIPIKECLTLLLQADGIIELGLGFAWEQGLEKIYITGRAFHIYQKISPGKAEQCAEIVLVVEQGVDLYVTTVGFGQGDGKGVNRAIVDKATYNISTLVAEKQGIQHLYLAIWTDALPGFVGQAAAQYMQGAARQQTDIAGQIGKGAAKPNSVSMRVIVACTPSESG